MKVCDVSAVNNGKSGVMRDRPRLGLDSLYLCVLGQSLERMIHHLWSPGRTDGLESRE